MRAEQTVSEMVVESLARQAEALSEGNSKTFADAYAEVLETPAGRQLGELAGGPTATRRPQSGKPACWPTARPGDRRACVPPKAGTRSVRIASRG